MGDQSDRPDKPEDPREPGSSAEGEQPDSTPSRPSIEADLRSLRTILEKTSRSWRLAAFGEGALWYVAGLGAVVLTALLVGLVVPAAVPAWTGGVLTLGGLALVVAAIAGVVRFVSSSVGAAGIARRLQDVEPSFRNDLVAAIEFAEAMLEAPEASDERLGFSRTLARSHLRQTVQRVRQRADDRGDLGELLPDRNIEPPLLAVAGCLTLVVGSGLLAPVETERILESPLSMTSQSDEGDDEIARPIVGDIRLTYSPPDYTEKDRRTARGSTGHVETVVGSEVTLETYPLMDVQDVEMVIETDSGQQVVSMKSAGGDRLRQSIVVTESGSYYFRAERPDGTTVREESKRSIELVADEPPGVSITSHEGEVEVSPDDVLDIEFAVEDDYGIQKVERLHYFAGASDSKSVEPIQVGSLNDTPENVDGSFKFDLRPLSLKPKDVVVFRLQATDNNSRTGPGVGKSAKLMLRVSSPEDKHLENIAAQRKLSEKLVSLLADYLENPVGERKRREDETYGQVVPARLPGGKLSGRLQTLAKIHRKQGEVLTEMGSLVDRLNKDPLATERDRTLFEGLHGHLEDLHERGESVLEAIRQDGQIPGSVGAKRAERGADYAAEAEATLEKSALRLLELIASQKMDAIQASREDIKQAKERLKRLLKRYKKSSDPELKKAIRREINRLRQRVQEMMSRMRMQIRQLPDRHINKEALDKRQLESGTRKMADDLSQLEKRLEQGDIDGALEALEKMDANLSSLSSEMDSQFRAAQPKGLSKLDKEISKMMDQVNDMEAAERKLEQETEKLQGQQQQKRQEQIEQMLDEFTDEMLQKVRRQLESLKTIEQQKLQSYERTGLGDNRKSLDRLREMLQQNDVKQALEAARESLDKLRTLRFNLELAGRHSQPDSERAGEVERARNEIQEMMPRGKEIERKLEQMMQRANSRRKKSASKEMKKLAERQKKLRKQARKMRKKIEKSSKEFPMMKQQLEPGIGKAEKQMKQAEKRLRRGQSQGALDSERSVLEKLGKLKRSMRQTLKKQRSKGKGSGRPDQREEVEIPGGEQGASRQELRQEVLEGMKGEKLEKYRKEIKRYYKSLVE